MSSFGRSVANNAHSRRVMQYLRENGVGTQTDDFIDALLFQLGGFGEEAGDVFLGTCWGEGSGNAEDDDLFAFYACDWNRCLLVWCSWVFDFRQRCYYSRSEMENF